MGFGSTQQITISTLYLAIVSLVSAQCTALPNAPAQKLQTSTALQVKEILMLVIETAVVTYFLY